MANYRTTYWDKYKVRIGTNARPNIVANVGPMIGSKQGGTGIKRANSLAKCFKYLAKYLAKYWVNYWPKDWAKYLAKYEGKYLAKS